MSRDDRLEKGLEMMAAVYGGAVSIPPEELDDPGNRLVLTNLFADVWGREAMSIRDRRLIIMGAIAAIADSSVFEIQVNAALQLGELTREQLPEIPLILTQYIGYPRTVPIMKLIERVLDENAAEADPDNSSSRRKEV